MKKVLLIVATEEEWDALKEAVSTYPLCCENDFIRADFGDFELVACQGGIGKGSMAFAIGKHMGREEFDLVVNTGIMSGYSVVTAADYTLKLLSSISPAYEDTIDELMFSQGMEGLSVFVKLGWIPRFPFTYLKNYYQNFRAPNNGPLSGIKSNLKRQIK